MNWFRNMKLRAKMLTGFMLVIALTMTLVGIAVTRIIRVRDGYMTVINHPLSLEIALWEFQSEYRNIRRIITAVPAYAEKEPARVESLFTEALAAYDSALACLDRAKDIVSTNQQLTLAEKDVRLANNDVLRRLFRQYHDEVIESMMRAARAGDGDFSLQLNDAAAGLAVTLGSKLNEMLVSAVETAGNHIESTEASVNATILLMVAISAITALLAVGIALYVANAIGKPLVPLAGFMHRVATVGDLTFSADDAAVIEKYARGGDELGRVTAAASAFAGRIAEIGKVLEKVADGDLTSGIPLLSNQDTIGLALKKMVGNLNLMFREINSSSVQVSAGSGQVADGAQALAAGAAQQAAAIEELSCTVAEVAKGTEHNAEKAEHAAVIAHTIKDGAEKGNGRMNAMMTAVMQISEASQSIGKVMKTINDIAFQTNILAVNVAVEAARAGRYGKGFKVVAGEVRSLATKSAEAAKDTERLIANSMDRAELGVRMAEETLASLSEIIAIINESSQLVSEIARSSEEQSVKISQINIGIDQVAQVVHQNSSTAAESAAASEEMNRQAMILKQLIAQFKLKKEHPMRNRLPGDGEGRVSGLLSFENALEDYYPVTSRYSV